MSFSIQVDFVIDVQDFICKLGGNSTCMSQHFQTHQRHIDHAYMYDTHVHWHVQTILLAVNLQNFFPIIR